MMFARTAESHGEFLAELPAFSKNIRKLFTDAQIQDHFERAELASRVDPDIFKGTTADEAEQLREALDDDRRTQERRSWVRAMLLREGSLGGMTGSDPHAGLVPLHRINRVACSVLLARLRCR